MNKDKKDCLLANLSKGLNAEEIDDLIDRFKETDLQTVIEKLECGLHFKEYSESKTTLTKKDKKEVEKYIEEHFLSPNCKYGVYRITDRLTGFQYIGKANNVYKRWFGHLGCMGTSGQDWHFELYSRPEDFYFEVIKECETESKTYIEEAKEISKAHYIDKIPLYNSIIPYKIYYSPAQNINRNKTK